MSEPNTSFAKGETIPFKVDQVTYAGLTESDVATAYQAGRLSFIFTVREQYGSRTIIDELKTGSGISAGVFDGSLIVTFDLETDTAEFTPGKYYEWDLWVIDTATGKHRLETGVLQLDVPETETLTLP